jgi:hypothetical protein
LHDRTQGVYADPQGVLREAFSPGLVEIPGLCDVGT